jgi:hypothetical protein
MRRVLNDGWDAYPVGMVFGLLEEASAPFLSGGNYPQNITAVLDVTSGLVAKMPMMHGRLDDLGLGRVRKRGLSSTPF